MSMIHDWWPTQDRSEILPRIWVGDETAAKALYGQRGWTIIDVREGRLKTTPPSSVVRIPLLRVDTHHNAGRKALEEIACAIDAARERGEQVLVHCWAGVERSPLSLAYWLVTREQFTLDQAYALLNVTRGVWDRREWLTKKARRLLEAA